MSIIQILKDDYQRFPAGQTYSIYADDVYFKDPMNEFRGVDRYKQMIGFIQTWLLNCQMDLHGIERSHNTIRTDWTLRWQTPLPWKPHIAITGWSELTLNEQDLITAHIDYWHCSKLNVLGQHFGLHQETAVL